MIYQSMRMAVKSIRNNKMRSFLTMLGIIIGVFALVVLVSLVDGASTEITESINALGTNLLSITVRDDHNHPIKMEDLREMTEHPEIGAAAPVVQTSLSVSSDYAEKTATVIGTTAPYAQIQNLKLAGGRFIMKPDEDNHTNVAVINSDMATEVMGRTNVVGETMKMGGREFQIIGVLEPEENGLSSLMMGSYVAYIPFSTLLRVQIGMDRNITSFYASSSTGDMDAAEAVMTDILLDRFEQDADAFFLFNQSSVADAMDRVTGTLSLLLGGIAAISLLVGGIGIMNIMLVSVTERTREIGIRKAIGAGRGVIMLQFLIEALMVSLIGCIIGLFFSWIALQVIDVIGDVTYGVSPRVAVAAVSFSMGIGVLFGLYPANKAARMKPIDALRFQ